MMRKTKDELKRILLDNFDYPKDVIDSTIEQIESLSPEGKENLSFLLDTGYLPNVFNKYLSLQKMKSQNPDMTDVALLIIYDGMTNQIENMKNRVEISCK